jgi:hypothetical protein
LKIKIPPYPNYGIIEPLFDKLSSEAVKTTNSSPLSNQLVMVTKFKTGERRVLRSRPIKHENNRYVSAFPNPVHIFLSIAVEHYTLSERIKNENFPKCGKKYGDDLFLLDIEENGTHTCHNNYIKYRSSSIVMLVSSIEAFLNHIIPNDFIYKSVRKGKPIEFDKMAIESPKISFNEKLQKVIPQYLESIKVEANFENEFKSILNLYKNRRNIIHLKTNAEDDLKAYFDEIDQMLDLNIKESIEDTISFMNKVKTEFIELD